MSSIITDPFRQKLLLGAIALGVVMDGIDGSIVNVALPVMATDFGKDTGTIAWVIITYLLMMAGLLLVFGKLAERGQAKRLFLLGFAVFTLGSAACGIAPSFEILLAARLVQGVGAAMIAAVAPMLCIRYLPREMLGTAFGVIAASASIGFAAGPAIGGFLTEYLSWHWIFLVNIPIGIAGILFAARVIPHDDPGCAAGSFDTAGAAAFFLAMVFCTFVLEEIASRGIADPLILACSAAFILCLGAVIFRERRVKDPFLNIRVFLQWQFTAALAVLLLINAVFMGIIYLLPFYLTLEMQYDLATSGLCLLIPPLVIAVIGIPFGKLSDQCGCRRVFVTAASALFMVTGGIFAVLSPGVGIIALVTALILLGVAFGISAGPAPGRVIEAAPAGEEGTGSSLMVTAVYFGGVLGTAAYAAFFTLVTTWGGAVVAFTDLDPARFLDGFHMTMLAGVVLTTVPLVLSAAVPDGNRKG